MNKGDLRGGVGRMWGARWTEENYWRELRILEICVSNTAVRTRSNVLLTGERYGGIRGTQDQQQGELARHRLLGAMASITPAKLGPHRFTRVEYG